MTVIQNAIHNGISCRDVWQYQVQSGAPSTDLETTTLEDRNE